jgi:hypothetical protein
MTVFVAADVTRGQSSLDTMRLRVLRRAEPTARTDPSRFVCIPYSDTQVSFANTSAVRGTPAAQGDSPKLHDTPRIYPIPIEERVYDHGWRENWRRLFAQPLFDQGMSRRR